MLKVGLTGGIASGKSLVARIFKDLGGHIIDADRIVHDLLESDQDVYKEVLNYFGKEVIGADKRIDRRKVGDIVFNNPEKRLWLNNCLHPRVFSIYNEQVRLLCDRQPECIVVFDAALLIETGYHRGMDRVIVVYADLEQQVERLIARENLSREQALARISSQMPLSEKRGKADFVIDNTGTRESTEQQARSVFAKLKQEAVRVQESSL
jgi:dephospho-CoA kinase